MRKAIYAAVACLFLAAPAGAQNGPGVRVGGWSLSANGKLAKDYRYTGSCPVSLKLDWGLIPAAPTRLVYRFERSDGGHSSHSLSADLSRANQSTPIYDEWKLGANTPQFANYSGWVNLIVESPVRLEKKIDFTIHCR